MEEKYAIEKYEHIFSFNATLPKRDNHIKELTPVFRVGSVLSTIRIDGTSIPVPEKIYEAKPEGKKFR